MTTAPLRPLEGPQAPPARDRLALASAGLLALLAFLGARGVASHVHGVATHGPLGTSLAGHPPWLGAAYYDWLATTSGEVARALGALLPADARTPIGHVGSVWSFGRIRYALFPRRVVDRVVPYTPDAIALAIPPGETVLLEDPSGETGTAVLERPGIERLGRVGSYWVLRRPPPRGEGAR